MLGISASVFLCSDSSIPHNILSSGSYTLLPLDEDCGKRNGKRGRVGVRVRYSTDVETNLTCQLSWYHIVIARWISINQIIT